MRKLLLSLSLSACFFFARPARADFAGADIPILLQILSNAVTQLQNLLIIVQQGRDTLGLMRDINSGISDALGVIQIVKNRPDLNLYKDWASVGEALQNLEKVYGQIPKSALSGIQKNTDVAIAETLAAGHSLTKAITQYDSAAQSIQTRARETSPKGAARLTAQGVGVLVQVMNESLRAESSALKLQAQTVANDNRKEKEETRQLKNAADSLATSFKNHHSEFSVPEF